MSDPEYKEHYIMTPEVKDHLEFYWGRFDKWNNDELYEPSFLFSYSERPLRLFSNFTRDDWEHQEIMDVVLGVVFGIAALILILALIFI